MRQPKNDNNNKVIQLTEVFMLFKNIMGPVEYDYIKRLILLFVFRLSGGHCTNENEAMPVC